MFILWCILVSDKLVGKVELNSNLATGWRSGVIFTLQLFYVEGNAFRYVLKE
jgi:hypothetical protein